MATETPTATPDMAKSKRDKKDKKRKNDKHDDEHQTSKKRKHSHHALETPAAEQPQSKKFKKDKPKPPSSTAQPQRSTLSKDELLRQHSPFTTQTTSLYLPLSPAAHAFPLRGLCAEHISPLLLTYYPPLNGVVLSYSNARISEHPAQAIANHSTQRKESEHVLAKSLDEYAPSFLWLTADFLLFKPARGTWMEGWVNLVNEEYIGLVCYNYFNAVIAREKMPEGWRWVEEHERGQEEGGGHFVDERGEKVEGRVVFEVEDFETGVEGEVGTVSILGTLRGREGKT
ncbi:uncharacterized protein LTR77_004170 [Saxophila tyrrhenica]|uniref:DNA-directed RNA polymerase subunit n=1 Tax=Saxophila tyrrhenica TaxID=1690608 RepID=A0AAV9PC11_9PEZI|nr:hypothetical protein LTR77_004170 [Saxophila tyrrhenica]